MIDVVRDVRGMDVISLFLCAAADSGSSLFAVGLLGQLLLFLNTKPYGSVTRRSIS
jgi:hypothetical protein